MATKLLREEDRRLDLTPNHGLSLPVRLWGSPHNDIGLVGEGLALLLPRRGEAIGQTTEIVIIVQVVVVQTLEVEPIRGLEVALDHAASTAFQISGAVLSLTRSLSSLN